MTTDSEIAERTRTALAEMGWGDIISVRLDFDVLSGITFEFPHGMRDIVAPIIYMAARVSTDESKPIACWSCWDTGELSNAEACINGKCPTGGPRMPPRELIRPPQ